MSTPEWRVIRNALAGGPSGARKIPLAVAEESSLICEVDIANSEHEQHARLIAAAPALLAALERCADWLCECAPGTDQWERGQQARAAVERALGQTPGATK